MAESIEVLKQKYHRALLAIQSTEERYKKLKEEKEDADEKNRQLEKQTRTLCQTILKKLPDKQTEKNQKDEKAWFTLETLELVAAADSALSQYVDFMTRFMKKTLAMAGKERKTTAEKEEIIASLEEKIRNKDELIEELKGKVSVSSAAGESEKGLSRKEERDLKAAINQAEGKAVSVAFDITDRDVRSIDIDSGEIIETVGESIDTITKGLIEKKLGHPFSVRTNAPISKAAKDVAEKYENEIIMKLRQICDNPEIMDSEAKLMIRLIGEYGLSGRKQIHTKMREMDPNIKSDSICTKAAEALVKKIPEKYGITLLDSENIKKPSAPVFGIYVLTDLGKMAYQYMFGREVKPSEAERLRKQHSTYEHGYGIFDFAWLLGHMPCMTNMDGTPSVIEYMTRRKEFAVDLEINGEKRQYIADIIVKQKLQERERTIYFEYETTKDQATDIVEKCNKMANVTDELNFLVNGKDAAIKMKKNLEVWLRDVDEQKNSHHLVFPCKRTKVVRIFTYQILKDNPSKAYGKWNEIAYWSANISVYKG